MNVFLLTLLLTSLPLIGEETEALNPVVENQESSLDGYQITFILPVDVTKTPRYNLVVTAPKGFKSHPPLDIHMDFETDIIEFIPENETINQWSEIITFDRSKIGKQIHSSNFLKLLKENILNNSKNGKVIKETYKTEGSIDKASFLLQYSLNEHIEIIGAQYFSGPLDCVGVQYTIRLGKNGSIKAAREKIENYFNEHVLLTHQ